MPLNEMKTLIAAFDWASTSIGPIGSWPQSLKTTVDIVTASPVPMVLLWGPDGIMIYNDAYAEFAGSRHPKLLGTPVLEGWPEVADFNRHVMEVVLGEGAFLQGQAPSAQPARSARGRLAQPRLQRRPGRHGQAHRRARHRHRDDAWVYAGAPSARANRASARLPTTSPPCLDGRRDRRIYWYNKRWFDYTGTPSRA